MKRKIAFSLIVWLLCKNGFAQNSQTHGISNYAGSQSVFINPALLAPSKLYADFVYSKSVNFTNNNLKSPVSFSPNFGEEGTLGLYDIDKFYPKLGNENLDSGQKLDLNKSFCLGAFIKASHKSAFAVNYKIENYWLVKNRGGRMPLKYINNDIYASRFDFTLKTLSLTYSQILFENKQNLLSGGINLNSYSIHIINSTKYNYSLDFGINYEFSGKNHIHKQFVDGKTIYYHDDYKYTFKVAASIQNFPLVSYDFFTKPIFADFLLDFNIYNNFYLTVHSNYRFKSGDLNGVNNGNTYTLSYQDYYHSYLSIQPRMEVRYLEIGIPVSYQNDGKDPNWNAGLVINILNVFYIGSDRLTNLFKSLPVDNYYFGFRIPITKNKISDYDNDGISNQYDRCVDERGSLAMKGCPDEDGDGIANIDDRCPEDPGLISIRGCPDNDSDMIANIDDICPYEYGSLALKGCPDSDFDSIADMDDRCPKEYGSKAFKGCPDTDKDSIADIDDRCPRDYGLITFQGCPDTDKDSIPDIDDGCPAVVGLRKNKGCPEKIIESIMTENPKDDLFKPTLYVLAIGISDYKDFRLKLGLAAKDARDFTNVLLAQKGLLYKDVQIKLITDTQASRANIIEGLAWLQSQVTSRDVAMFFIAGHGLNDNYGNFYFLPYEADVEKLKSTCVPYFEVTSTIASITGKIIVFADACHSGNIMGTTRRSPGDIYGWVTELSNAENMPVIYTSSARNQYSLEDTTWNNGAFTKAVVEGLSGKGDFNGDGIITIKSLDLYISNRVKILTSGKQTPTTIVPGSIRDYPIALKR